MDFTLIALSATIFGISALPIEPYSGVPTANPQPIYWLGSPTLGQFSYDSTLTPQVSSVYRNAAPTGPPLQPSAQYNPVFATAFAHDIPIAKAGEPNTTGYTLLSPSSSSTIIGQNDQPGLAWIRSDVSASNGAPPNSEVFSPIPIPQLNIQNSNPLDSKLRTTSGIPLESAKESKNSTGPRVTIFAPGSLIGSDLIHTFLEKSLQDSQTGVFIYAPGSLFISKDEAELGKSILGPNYLFHESSILTQQRFSSAPTLATTPVSLDPKAQTNAPSDISSSKESGEKQGISKKEEKENSEEEGEDDSDDKD